MVRLPAFGLRLKTSAILCVSALLTLQSLPSEAGLVDWLFHRDATPKTEAVSLQATAVAENLQVAHLTMIGPVSTVRARKSSATASVSALAMAVLNEINHFRARHGVPPLLLDPRLNDVAQMHSDDMAVQDTITHYGKDGSTPDQRISKAGYVWRAMAENVAAGEETVKAVVQDWINSPAHRKNMLEPDMSHLGVGYSKQYWTIDLAG